MTELAYAEKESPLKKIGGMMLTLLIMVSIVGGAFYYFRLTHPKSDLSDHPQTERITKALKDPKTASYYRDLIPVETTSKDNPGARSAPAFNVGRYTVATTLPFLPAQTKIFTFKNSFSEEETLALAQRLLSVDAKLIATSEGVRTYNSAFGYLIFNTKTGTFALNSVGSATPLEQLKTISDIRPALTNYLKDSLNIIDETTTLTAYYQRNTTPDVTYYEFHRDQEQMGLQIINPIGVANLTEDVQLDKVSLNSFAADAANDATIILASDTPGKARRTDFNALTVGVNSAGAIISIESNLRPIESSEYVSGLALSILSPDEAIEELQNKGTYFNITVPSGQGNISYDKVYLNNELKTKEAVITDMALSFIEKPVNVAQRYLQPVYIVRGYAETDTGVRVKFVQTIPAVSSLEETAAKPFFIKPAFALEQEIQIPCPNGSGTCTFETFKNTPTPPQNPTPTTIAPSPTTPQSPSSTPPPPSSDKCVIYNLAGDLIEEGQPIFVAGIGTVYYFSNLASGPLVVENSVHDQYSNPQEGDASLASLPFEENIQNELLAIGAEIMINEPSRVTYGNNGLDLKKLYGLTTDIQNLPNVDYGNGVGERALYWDQVANTLYLERFNLASLTNHPTPLSDAGLTNETIWLARRNMTQFGIQSRSYNNFRVDSRCRFLTTISPLLFFYPEKLTALNFSFDHDHVAYADPYLKKNLTFTAQPNGELNFGNNILRSRLHYEYADVHFTHPKNGWVISSDKVVEKAQSIATNLRLTSQETDVLMKEIHRAKADLAYSSSVFVGLIEESALNKQLPFSLSPAPTTIRRIHIYLEPVATIQTTPGVVAPKLSPIERKGFTIIELGAYVQQ